MISLRDLYNVVAAMTPLFVALGLGYGSVKWWHIFNPEQCEAINRLVSLFTLPLFTFEFTSHVDPFDMNYRFLAADGISKVIIILVLAVWAKCCSKGSYCWSITSFSLSTLTNALVVGVPLLKAMYGPSAQALVVQASVVQSVIWLTFLLFVFELRDARADFATDAENTVEAGKGIQGNNDALVRKRPSFRSVMKVVWLKLALNPNSYASIVAVAWALVSNRWHFEMPSIVNGSIQIMSNAGSGMAMFSMGNFMASQEKLIACGTSLAVFGMVLKFIAGPAAMAMASIAVGLHGTVLRVAIIQAAVPQSITSFIYAREYGLHPEVLSTASRWKLRKPRKALEKENGYVVPVGFCCLGTRKAPGRWKPDTDFRLKMKEAGGYVVGAVKGFT